MKIVYVGMIADLLHAGHIRVLKEAAKYGKVIVGLFTGKACGEIDSVPYLDYAQRKEVLDEIKYISEVIPQETASYKNNLLKIKPDFVVHGDDWKYNYLRKYRQETLETLEEWNAELIEIPYSSEISDSKLKDQMMSLGITNNARLGRLRKLISYKPIVKILEVHNALSALIAENAEAELNNQENTYAHFDGMWSSSLTDSTAKGKPDIEAVDTSTRMNTINEIFEVTTKPLIYDGDTGGRPEHFEFTVKTLERFGVSAVIIEDKIGLKKNSLLGLETVQEQDSIANFCYKIKTGKKAQITKDFMLIARIESFILEKGLKDALNRAEAYTQAGADGIMIHSRQKDPAEVIEFVKTFRKNDKYTPLVVVPTSFNGLTCTQLADLGINVVIYANHLLRAAYPAMMNVAKAILKYQRSLEAEKHCMSIKEILELIPGNK